MSMMLKAVKDGAANGLQPKMRAILKTLTWGNISSGFKKFYQGKLSAENYASILYYINTFMQPVIVPLERYPIDPPETRNRLLAKDYAGNGIGLGFFVAAQAAFNRLAPNPKKAKLGLFPVAVAGMLGLLVGTVAKTLFQGLGGPVVSAKLDEKYFQKMLQKEKGMKQPLNVVSQDSSQVSPPGRESAFRQFYKKLPSRQNPLPMNADAANPLKKM